MVPYVVELLGRHELLAVFVWRDIKIKYKQSVMGFLWALLMPMLIVLAGVFVRVAFARFSGGAIDRVQVASVAVKAVAWSFFVATLRTGTASLIGNTSLVSKIRFPKIIFPLASMLSALFDLCVAGLVVFLVLGFMGVRPEVHMLWMLPLLLLLAMVVFGLTALLAVANLFFRDVKYIVEVLVTFAIFFTPVFYEVSMFGPWGHWLMLNPVAPILEGMRSAVVLGQTPSLGWLAYCMGVGAVLSVSAVYAFARLEPRFAENI
jgi:ABC-type polysaccharide/polyol phosphate export permease